MSDLTERLLAAEKQNLEASILAYQWMVAHDRLKAGEPYAMPSPADPPASESRIAALEAELDRVRGALGFYADPKRHRGANQRREADDPFTPENDYYRIDVTRDNGRIARQALSPGEE